MHAMVGTNVTKIRWHRSDDGFVESKCGQWRIVPNYCGTTRPQDYQLWRDNVLVEYMARTQRDAKETAERVRGQNSGSTSMEGCSTNTPIARTKKVAAASRRH